MKTIIISGDFNIRLTKVNGLEITTKDLYFNKKINLF